MVEITIVPSRPEDAEELAPCMRASDRDEVFAASGKTPLEALQEGLALSDECYTIRFDGKVAAMFGVVKGDETSASPWMLGSNELKRVPWRWMRIARQTIDLWALKYGLLLNVVHADYRESQRLIEWLGFQLMPRRMMGPTQHSFIPFWK